MAEFWTKKLNLVKILAVLTTRYTWSVGQIRVDRLKKKTPVKPNFKNILHSSQIALEPLSRGKSPLPLHWSLYSQWLCSSVFQTMPSLTRVRASARSKTIWQLAAKSCQCCDGFRSRRNANNNNEKTTLLRRNSNQRKRARWLWALVSRTKTIKKKTTQLKMPNSSTLPSEEVLVDLFPGFDVSVIRDVLRSSGGGDPKSVLSHLLLMAAPDHWIQVLRQAAKK